ncbi:MAG: polymer-forming cytoskeletal protein [Alphaproteobacteria bacterium]|nr:polymer-forming cytoskeletal protein [Alphaproteobacteria bacterium]
MFTKSKPSKPAGSDGSGASVKPAKSGPPSIVAADMRVLGDLESEGDVQIDGRVDGDLRIRTVTVGQGATVNGAIYGDTIRIAGTVNGEIRGGSVLLADTARVVGDIHHKTLSIEAGAFLQGLCKRDGEEVTPEADSTSKSKQGNGQSKTPA